MERKRELLVGDASEIALDTVEQPDAGLGRPVGENLGNIRKLDEVIEDRPWVGRTEENVKIADRLGTSPEAPADLGSDHTRIVTDRLEDRSNQPPSRALQDPVADRFEEVDPFEDLGFRLAPKPLRLAIFPDSPASRRSARLSTLRSS